MIMPRVAFVLLNILRFFESVTSRRRHRPLHTLIVILLLNCATISSSTLLNEESRVSSAHYTS